jgi:ADP-ribosylglycohydrolase
MNKENVSDNVYSNFYKKAIMDTVSIAGDTNTNASIVSGLIGAAIGVHAI